MSANSFFPPKFEETNAHVAHRNVHLGLAYDPCKTLITLIIHVCVTLRILSFVTVILKL